MLAPQSVVCFLQSSLNEEPCSLSGMMLLQTTSPESDGPSLDQLFQQGRDSSELRAELSHHLAGEGLPLICEYSLQCSKDRDKSLIQDFSSSQNFLVLGHISPGVPHEMVHDYQDTFDLRCLAQVSGDLERSEV